MSDAVAQIVESFPGILFTVRIDHNGDFRFASMSDAGLIAMGLTREQVVGALVHDVIPPPSRDSVLNHYRTAMQSGQTVRWREVSNRPAGRTVADMAVTPLHDERGVATQLIGVVHDITERERLEEALRQREGRLAFLLKLNDALRPLSNPEEMQDVTLRLLGEHLGVNRVGYSVIDGDEFIVTRSYDAGVVPFRGRGSIAAYGAALLEEYQRGESVAINNVSTDPRFSDAERANLLAYDMAAFVRVMLRKGGRWVATFGVNNAAPREWTRDEIMLVEETAERTWSAAERARAESALRDSSQRLRLALDASAGGSWTWDTRTNQIDWDGRFREIYGFAHDEPANSDAWVARVYEEDRKPLMDILANVLQSRQDAWDNTFRIVRPDHSVSWIQSLGRADREEGHVLRLTGVDFDVTQRLRNEEVLRERREEERDYELRLLLETATQGIVSTDAGGTILSANRAMEKMFGWEPGALIGQSIEVLVPGALRDEHHVHRVSYLAGAHPRPMGLALELGGQRKDGSAFPIEVSSNHVGPAGAGRVFAFVTDTTDRHRAATALQERTKELERRTTQLSQMASDLTLAEQRAREEISKTLHDGLQQLLLIASLHIEQHIKRVAEHGMGPSDTLAEAADHVAQAIAAARSLSIDLYPPVLQQAGLSAAMSWLASWAQGKYGLTVEVYADPLADSTRKDVRTLLFESTRELLVNVVKHAGASRVTLSMKLDPDGQIRITVADDGIGFDPERLVAESTAGRVGWGLFSIRERLSLLGGRFEIDSAPNCGARFQLVAPCDAVALPVQGPEDHGVPISPLDVRMRVRGTATNALRVLIVDDHAGVRKALHQTIRQWPQLHVVGEATDGHEAIAQTRSLQPEVVLMDISMPRMDGIEATRRLHTEFPMLCIFGWSVQPRPQEIHPIEIAGASGFFVKGTDTQRLIDALLSVHARLNAIGDA